jgi:predicted dithiol-disulfide oxidoreductase (DUF899 family)
MSTNNIAMKTPPVVSPHEWEAARRQLLVKEKAYLESTRRESELIFLCGISGYG